MKRSRPLSMFRANLLVLIPLVLAGQAVAVTIWWFLVQRPKIDDAASLVGYQIVLADRLLATIPPDERQRELTALGALPTAHLPHDLQERAPGDVLVGRFFTQLLAHLPAGVELRWRDDPSRQLWVRLYRSDDLWLLLPTPKTVSVDDAWGIALVLLVLAAFPSLGAWWIHRRVEGPLKALARASRDLQQHHWPDPVPVRGPLELATVTESFNGMAATLAEIESARAAMMAGFSHDIRTPLTKLRLVTSSPASFDRPAESAERFIEEIDAIVGQFVDYARGGDGEDAVPGDINRLVEQLAADYTGLGHVFVLDLAPLPRVPYRPIAMQRVLMNLMQNAVLYGRVGLSVRTSAEPGIVVIEVAEGGPGLADAALDQVKQPFRRGPRATAQGTGLGLAIVDRIVRQHGGTFMLARSAAGGLAAIVRLPA